jgi:hypothetical protein
MQNSINVVNDANLLIAGFGLAGNVTAGVSKCKRPSNRLRITTFQKRKEIINGRNAQIDA